LFRDKRLSIQKSDLLIIASVIGSLLSIKKMFSAKFELIFTW